MKCSEQVKLAGLKSLRQFSEITGVPKQTLTDWYNGKKKRVFMMDSAVRESNE
jgi:hypothetical protein